MNLTISGHHLDVTPSLREYVLTKLDRVTRHFDQVVDITVLLSGVRDEHDNVFSALGTYDHLAHERHVFATTPEAIEHAMKHVSSLEHH